MLTELIILTMLLGMVYYLRFSLDHPQRKPSGCATKRAGLSLLTEVLIGLVRLVILLLTIMESATVRTPYLVAILLAAAYGVPCKPSKFGAVLLTLTWSAMIYVTMISRRSDEWTKIELLGLVVATMGMIATVYLTRYSGHSY